MDQPSPTAKLLRALGVAALLSIGIFITWLLISDRHSQSLEARGSIAEGWGGPQVVAGPELSIPFKVTTPGATDGNGRTITGPVVTEKRLVLAPTGVDLTTRIAPERRARSIYEVVVYRADTQGRATFALPADLSRLGVPAGALELNRAELRFGVADPRGLSANPQVRVNGRTLPLGPGGGTSLVATGFYAPIDLTQVDPARFSVDLRFALRGNESFALAPRAGDTAWKLTSPWANPSFTGGFLPEQRSVTKDGFTASYRIGNLALGRSLLFVDGAEPSRPEPTPGGANATAGVSLMQPVDLYSQVDRATKYGFLFIGFTFLAFLLFDIIGGVRVAAIEYLLTGAALVLFFVLLLAFAEVIGFTAAYVVAAGAIAVLNTAYSAAVLRSWRRGLVIGGILLGLYAMLYILLSLEAYSLLIGSLLLFVALAGTMYVTRRLDWTGARREEAAATL
ncbi:cell envelope integrity protein CreD [Sphingomonas sp. BN140010]|uniref:Cell envelope integrity protein CreD n=1 Tax=Sphingomonas arvum TaxID=2992113 RepID=A0ABT3JBG9_9SPHN|nr:cell envelope integrity protein CreD [Sphingomonas sp. BN140010]MCW3796366.1 cell envelope integrity protein CreD [Sphingomonas sp. BN140010]